MHKRSLLVGGAALVVAISAIVTFSGAASAQKPAVHSSTTPTKDVVGIGAFNCAVVTGEVGFSPTTSTSGSSTTTETVSIWFQATKCSAVPGAVAKPLPKTVVGSESFISNNGDLCPQLGSLGTGTLNLSYNFPPVPNPIIDPTVGQAVSVAQSGPNWILTGPLTAGSYAPAANFTASLRPVVVGTQTCGTGVTSMYIKSGSLSNV